MTPFVHPSALCESTSIGARTRVWAFVHILPGAKVGEDCNLCDNVFIENDVVIGNRVTIKCGVQVWDGIRLEDDVFVGPNATFTNDPFPRSRQHPDRYTPTVVRRGASIGANATILPGITIGEQAMVGAGSVVTRSVPPNAIVTGNPARIVGYVDSIKPEAVADAREPGPAVSATSVRGVTLHRLPLIRDMRGDLSVGEFGRQVPFAARRYFMVFDVPSEDVRGEHAHRECHQFLLCVRGRCRVVVDDGQVRAEIALDRPNLGMHIPPMVWSIQYQYSADALLLVFASHYYDPSDYIREYGEFAAAVARTRAATLQ
jgi:acetyltransferase-like isoleucine patch superfamily enzyme/dTDP-4-dehydrorhamnose 3,5-epimerase-like enzyme